MDLPQFNSPELKNANIVKSSITAPEIDTISATELKESIKQLLAKKDYKLINAFEHGTLSISPCSDEKLLFKALFDVLRNQLLRSVDTSNNEQLVIVNKIFDSVLGILDILALQKINLNKDTVIASFLGILIKNL